MKLIKEDTPYLTKAQWKKIFLAMSIMTLVLYVVAMIFSLCGSHYFILNYQNAHLDKIQEFMESHHIRSLISWGFSTLEFFIISCFILKSPPKWYFVLTFYLPLAILADWFAIPRIVYTIFPFLFYLIMPLFKDKGKSYWRYLIRLLIATAASMGLQAMILVIKAGYFDGENHIMNLATHFIYAIEYDIALSVILFTVSLYINREKGDNESWTEHHTLGGSSQTSMKLSLKSSTKNLTKTQKNKIRLFYFKMYIIQLGTFLLVMVLPFLLGKVFEFLVMYTSFCVTRYILGFKYSLHYKKEVLCITVGIAIFGTLSLVVPFFYVVMIVAITLGVGLAILLHLSYKYKGFYLFNKIAKPDKFAELYVIFDGDLSEPHVKRMCYHYKLSKEETQTVVEFVSGDKISVIAYKHSYSVKTIERQLTDSIDKLKQKL